MRVYWCDVRPLLSRPEPFLAWCRAGNLSPSRFLRLEDGILHHTGRLLRQLAQKENPGAGQGSVSHSGALALCAWGAGPLGVDVEALIPSAAPFPSGCLTEEEGRWLALQSNPAHAFLRLWTGKESLLKALGLALGDLPRLPSLVQGGQILEQVGAWYLQSLPILPRDYISTLCSHGTQPASLRPVSPGELFP